MKSGKKSFHQKIQEFYKQVTLKVCRVEVLGCQEVTIQGGKDILEYRHERIVISVDDPTVVCVVIQGKDLFCISYHSDAVLIRGNISGFSMEKQLPNDSDNEWMGNSV